VIDDILKAWAYARKRRPLVRVALIDPADGTSLILHPNAAIVIQVALQALADRESEDPMSVSQMVADALGKSAPSTETLQ